MKTLAHVAVLARQVAIHAFDSHGSEFGIMSAEEFEPVIRDTLLTPSEVRTLENGRMAYWNDGRQMVIIENTRSPERSTAFRPTSGKAYFENLR